MKKLLLSFLLVAMMLMGVVSIPCMILFVDGKEKNRLVGLQSKDEIIAFIDENK